MINNKDMWKMVRGLIVVVNQYNQDAIVECVNIKQLVEQSYIDIAIKRVNSHKKLIGSF